MTTYFDSRFLNHLNIDKIYNIIEIGARYGDESIQLSKIFKKSIIYSFECNPLTVNICKNNLQHYKNINFFDYGLGNINENLPFYSFIKDNDGASSFYKRIDFNETQKETGIIKIKKLVDFVKENNIEYIDLLCMDVQGYELNILKGEEDFIRNIKYIIMEEPKPKIDRLYLPEGVHSKYINAPTS
jgi:FkbM family methyltransferase